MLNTQGAPSMHFKAQIQISNLLLCLLLNVEDETAPFLVKCRKTFIGAGLGFCNRRVHLFNLWFNNQKKGLSSLSQWFKGLQTEAFRFLVSKVLSGGNSTVKKKKKRERNSTDEINAKSCEADIWLLGYFLSMRMFWYKCFPEAPKWCKETVYSKCPGNLLRQLLALKTLIC